MDISINGIINDSSTRPTESGLDNATNIAAIVIPKIKLKV